MNDVRRPAQLAPLWHMAGRATGVAIDPAIWHLDPPASSYPACIAVKAAALQGSDAARGYLSLTRAAVMTRRLNVARRNVLLQLADELAGMTDTFDARRFERDLGSDDALEAFRGDLQRVRFVQIGRFPTLIVHGALQSRIAVGYRSSDVLEEILSTASAA
jgi:predicted DsbA family dithiol-disulfide isomerase